MNETTLLYSKIRIDNESRNNEANLRVKFSRVSAPSSKFTSVTRCAQCTRKQHWFERFENDISRVSKLFEYNRFIRFFKSILKECLTKSCEIAFDEKNV